MKTAAHHLWALLLAVAVVVPAARGVWFDLPSTGIKCVGEEIHNSVVVVADYYAFYGVVDDVNTTVSPSISVQVPTSHLIDFFIFFPGIYCDLIKN